MTFAVGQWATDQNEIVKVGAYNKKKALNPNEKMVTINLVETQRTNSEKSR